MENVLTQQKIHNFAYTLMIPSFKKINWDGEYKPYGVYSYSSQKEYLGWLLKNVSNDDEYVEYYNFTAHFESHADGRLHAHGTFFVNRFCDIEDIRFNIMDKIRIKALKQQRDIFYYVPVYDLHGWESYATKDDIFEQMCNDLIDEEKKMDELNEDKITDITEYEKWQFPFK